MPEWRYIKKNFTDSDQNKQIYGLSKTEELSSQEQRMLLTSHSWPAGLSSDWLT